LYLESWTVSEDCQDQAWKVPPILLFPPAQNPKNIEPVYKSSIVPSPQHPAIVIITKQMQHWGRSQNGGEKGEVERLRGCKVHQSHFGKLDLPQ